MAIAKSSVFVADVTGPRGPAGSIHKGAIPNGSNINTWHTPAYEGSWTFSGSGAATLTGLPSGVVAGQLFVLPGLGGQFLTSFRSTGSPEAFWFRGRTGLSGGFGAWMNLNSTNTIKNSGIISAGDNLDYWFLPEKAGFWSIASTTTAREVGGLPVPAPGKLWNDTGGVNTQMYFSYGITGYPPGVWTRQRLGLATSQWTEWVNLMAGGGGGGGDADTEQYALKHAFRVDEARKRLGYKLGTGGKAAIALQFDDYNAAFRDKVLPILREFDIPATMALAVNWVEGKVNHALAEAVPWPTVQSWVLNDGIEPQGHSWSHGPASTYSSLKKEIIDSADHMEKQMPSTVIDGWSMPGTGGEADPYGGYNGQSIKDFTETTAGKMLLSRYAFVGARKGGYMQPGGGYDLIGQAHGGIGESSSAQEFRDIVEEAIEHGYALTGLHHPGWLDTPGYRTTAELRADIQWLAQQRDAGRIIILTRRALFTVDPSEDYRNNLLPGGFNGALKGWDGWSLNSAGNPSSSGSAALTYPLTLLPVAWSRGSIREFHAVVKASATSVVRLAVSGGATNVSKDYTIPAGSWVEIRKFFAVPKVGGSTLNFSLTRVSGGTVEVQQINAYAA